MVSVCFNLFTKVKILLIHKPYKYSIIIRMSLKEIQEMPGKHRLSYKLIEKNIFTHNDHKWINGY